VNDFMVLNILELQLTLTFLLCILHQVFYIGSRLGKRLEDISTQSKKLEQGDYSFGNKRRFFLKFLPGSTANQ